MDDMDKNDAYAIGVFLASCRESLVVGDVQDEDGNPITVPDIGYFDANTKVAAAKLGEHAKDFWEGYNDYKNRT